MRSTLENAVIWAVLVLYWVLIKVPAWLLVMLIAMADLVLSQVLLMWREAKRDFDETRKVADL